jgi:hypothetical protein
MSSSNAVATGEEENLPETSQDLTVFVQNLLEQMVCSVVQSSHIFIFKCKHDLMHAGLYRYSNKDSTRCHLLLLEGVST